MLLVYALVSSGEIYFKSRLKVANTMFCILFASFQCSFFMLRPTWSDNKITDHYLHNTLKTLKWYNSIFKPLPNMSILGSSTSAANKDMMEKI